MASATAALWNTAGLPTLSSTSFVWKVVSSRPNVALGSMFLLSKEKVAERAVIVKHGNGSGSRVLSPGEFGTRASGLSDILENQTGKTEYALKIIEETHGTWSKLANRSPLDSSSMPRREVMQSAILLLMSAVAVPAIAAEEEEFALYEDTEDKFSLLVPQVWTKGEGMAGQQKVTAFYPENDTSANGLGADYTGLGSFGTIDIFAENLVNSLDRAWKKPKGQACKLIDSRAKNGMYYIEYTIQKPGEAKRHLLSVVGIAFNGWINRLYTVTGQYWEEDGDKYKASLEKAVSSFRLA